MKKRIILKRTMVLLSATVFALLLPALACAQGGVSGTAKTDVYTATADLTVTDTQIVGTVTFTNIPDKVCPSAESGTGQDFWFAWSSLETGKDYSENGLKRREAREDELLDMFGTMELNDDGEHVRAFQRLLADAGYYGREIDGVYDVYTAAAKMMYHSIRYLSTEWREGMNSELAVPVADEETIAAISSETGGMLEGVKAPISLSYQSDDVLKLQQALKKLRIYDGEATGNVGIKTEKAIMHYRVTRGLDTTDFNLAFVPDYVLTVGGQKLKNLDGAITDSAKGTCILHVRFELPDETGTMILHPANTEVADFDIRLQ